MVSLVVAGEPVSRSDVYGVVPCPECRAEPGEKCFYARPRASRENRIAQHAARWRAYGRAAKAVGLLVEWR